ncbi:flotillin-like FloA family protein [Labilibacter marinus]|uniref:flotillin-like FloA family protein n=1 Tax=Labilibacter marinus TaxID=1477105 RepID=UPI000836BE0E|nr:flotillin-like FloA family protein [Labilibacter marinus]
MEILILILLLFFIVLLGLPILVTKLRAKVHGADISFKEAFGLNMRRTSKKSLFKALALTQKYDLDLKLPDLESHHLAGGNTKKVVERFIKHKDKKGVTYQMLTALDIMGKDIDDAIQKTIEIHTITINDLDFRTFKIDIWAKFKHGIGVAFWDEVAKNNGIQERIQEKLSMVAKDWTSTDPISSQNFIRNNILNSEYWESVLGVQLIQQKLILKK